MHIPLSDIRPVRPTDQKTFNQAHRVLQIRRHLIDLKGARAEQHGLILQLEADAEEIAERMAKEPGLPGHRRKHLQGRLEVCQAKIERRQELMGQLEMEIGTYMALLIDTDVDTGTGIDPGLSLAAEE